MNEVRRRHEEWKDIYISIHSYTCETSEDLGEQKRKKSWSSMTLKFVFFFVSILVQHANINEFY